MLSKIAVQVLGLIAEKPLNPYEIIKLLEKFHLMYTIPSSSIYATINALVKKKYITGKKAKEGKMPEKTIYSITKKGEKALENTLKSYLTDSENIFSEFHISMSFICHLSKNEAIEALKIHHENIQKEITRFKGHYRELKKTGVLPYTALLRRQHYIYKREAEQKTIKELIKNIEIDTKWNHFPVTDLSI